MVELNFDRRRPARMMDLNRVRELDDWHRDGDDLVIGAGRHLHPPGARMLAGAAPGLAIAARTVGSPQIRNRGTVGGNLATSSPAGDLLPPLVACGAVVEVASATGARSVPLDRFCTGPKRNVLGDDELITGRPGPGRARAPAVRQGGPAQRHGHRRLLVRDRARPRGPLGGHGHRLGRPHGDPGGRRRGASCEGVLDEGGRWESRAPLSDSELAALRRARGRRRPPDRRRARQRRLPPPRPRGAGPPHARRGAGRSTAREAHPRRSTTSEHEVAEASGRARA